MLKGVGRISVEPKNGRVVVQLCKDFVRYYIWFIERYFKIRVNSPMHGGHISIALPQFDPNVDWKEAMKYQHQLVEFEYDPYIRVGGKIKNKFRNFIIDFTSEELRAFSYIINTSRTSANFHITIGNTKSIGIVDYWPEMIEINYEVD